MCCRPEGLQATESAVNQHRSSRTKWLLTAVKLLIVIVVLWAIRRTIVDAISQLGEHSWHVEPVWLAVAGVLYLLGLLPAALFWHRLLHRLGQEAKFWETLRAYYVGHLGKYVPGKAMVIVIRAGLIRSHRVSASVAVASVFFETMTMMSVGAFLAAAILAFWSGPQPFSLMFWGAIGLMVLAGLPTLPPVFKRLVRLARIDRSDPTIAENLQRLRYGTLLFGWITMGLGWIVLGMSLWAVLRGMGVAESDSIRQFLVCTAGVCLAMVAGFLSLIPGGAVVREAILTEVLAKLMVPHPGEVVALISAVLLRLVWLVSELIISTILYVGVSSFSKTQPPQD
jgi:uncharacterized membrane protein YbhN (UPF0104 family)